jgi:S1-C subfamily serine protease
VAINWLDVKGPLREAGFELGDIILGINNQPITGVESFVQLVSSLKPNQKASLLALDHKSGNSGTVLVTVR